MDEQALIEYVTQQRWYGSKSRAVMRAQLLDSVVLRTTFRASDLPARMGGDEFCILLRGDSATSAERAVEPRAPGSGCSSAASLSARCAPA